ncbi:MAG: hypothetical protein VYE73_15250, partial [Acidobacteriota bacterium]|nr:hypothetical protein [Acidobacteriota bacterium]
MDTAKIDLKVYAASTGNGSGASGLELDRLIPVFHRWIKESRLVELPIDVVDYSHVPDGPGVLLVCHDAQYGVEGGDGELGLLYSRRRETHPSLGGIATLEDRIESVFERALAACARLQIEASLGGRLRFPSDHFLLRVNDRRIGEESFGDLSTALHSFFARLLPQTEVSIEVATEAGRVAARISVAGQPGATALSQRL